jgi:hypothetical protein
VKYQSNKQLVNEVKKDTEITGIHQGADAQSASRGINRDPPRKECQRTIHLK